MIKRILFVLIFILSIISQVSLAQKKEITGFWIVDKVSMEGQSMTPIAKWKKIHEDGTYESGNGWLKHEEGVWSYDEAEQSFLPEVMDKPRDPFGAFTVEFEGELMLWTREEEGTLITVTLSRITELPASPADKVQGLWALKSAEKNGTSVLNEWDPKGVKLIYIGWDRNFRERTAEGNMETGFWHMHAHRPDLTLLPHNAERSPESWRVDFNAEGELLLKGVSDSNREVELYYSRLDEFP